MQIPRRAMIHTSLLTVHLVGLVLGLGGATFGDLLILRSMARRIPVPVASLRDLSYVIWTGLAVLTASGVGLLAESPSVYLHNSGFIAKLVLVAVLMLNGAYLDGRMERFNLGPVTLFAGAVSTVSWYGALVLAMFKTEVRLPLAIYLAAYASAVLVTWNVYRSLYRYFDVKTKGISVQQVTETRFAMETGEHVSA